MRRYRLIAARKSREWTQVDVAQKLNITAGFYGMLEQGSRNPRLPLAFSLERLFGVPVAELFPDLFCPPQSVGLYAQRKTASIRAVNE